jgi:hypothetical protein
MGINGNKDGTTTDLQSHLAHIHSTHCAMPDGNGYTCRCRQQFDRRSDHAAHVAAIQAEVLAREFDILPKGNLTARLQAFSRDCVQHGDMTPMAARMLSKIADELILSESE